jgi:acetyl-CoA synthetase
VRLAVPKAYVTLAAGHAPSAQTAYAILKHARDNLAPYQRVRRLEFTGATTGGELPKTISGKIRRVELRGREEAAHAGPDEGLQATRGEWEFWEEDFPDLKA